jgi:hypothetical protein
MMRKLYFHSILVVFIFCSCSSNRQKVPQRTMPSGDKMKILFDATKGEMLGNADWVIDADEFNLGYNNTGRMMEGRGNEANPQRLPTPAQENITADTKEDYWTGALSAWGIDCVKEGFYVETLPIRGRITYGDTSNEEDLSHYKVYIVDEPNIKFDLEEKNAILKFVEQGGGLFMISDHDGSDRNKDHWDSPRIWNEFIIGTTIPIEFDLVKLSQKSDRFENDKHPVLDGKYGRPHQLEISAGTTMHLGDGAASLCLTKQSKDKTHGVLVAACSYGKGRIVALSDSSPPDDGTGDPNDKLFKGYNLEVNGDHRILLMNAVVWLSGN